MDNINFGKEFLKELEAESLATRKCLERVPESLFDWKPHEKSMTMGYLSLLVAEIPRWITHTIPFDLPDVEYTHYGDRCTFDYIIEKHQLKDPALKILAAIVRGADTDRHDLAAQASGLWAISAGLSQNIKDDQELLNKGMMIYDALYTWAKYLQHAATVTKKLIRI